MRKLLRLIALALLALTGKGRAADDEPRFVPATGAPGGELKLVDRDQLRVGSGTKRVAMDKRMRVALDSAIVVPEKIDWSKAGTIDYPLLGNDRYGDCYPVAGVKCLKTMIELTTGTPVVIDERKLVARYLAVSHGDNGTSDTQMYAEMKGGMIGPNGPMKILDWAVVSSTDAKARALTLWAFGPQLFTFSVPAQIMQEVKQGAVWDAQHGRYVGGHAVLTTAQDEDGNATMQTWGLKGGVKVTPRFIANNDPETITVFSSHWFDGKGYAPNKLHYTTLAPLWTSITGGVLPPSPYPPPEGPTPPIPPAPPAVGTFTVTLADLSPAAKSRLEMAGVQSLSLTVGYGGATGGSTSTQAPPFVEYPVRSPAVTLYLWPNGRISNTPPPGFPPAGPAPAVPQQMPGPVIPQPSSSPTWTPPTCSGPNCPQAVPSGPVRPLRDFIRGR